MKRPYRVTIKEVWMNTVEVEAESREDAIEQALAQLESGDCGEFDFAYTMEPEDWHVEEGD